MNILPRCVGACRDNTQCSRRVKDGSNPPLCHLHRANPALSPIIPQADDLDELKLLRRLAHDRDSRVRLRAVDLLIKIRDRAERDNDCPRCAARQADARQRADVFRRLTDAQKEEGHALLKRWQDIKAAAATQPIQGDSDYV